MKITVVGLWHLGSVTAACCAKHCKVTGLDFDDAIIGNLQQGKAPLFEPGLNELIAEGLKENSLQFTTDPETACADAQVLWVCYDTPVNENDESNVQFVIERIERCLPRLAHGTLVLISSQLPVGTARQLETGFPELHFAVSPENLRLGQAIAAFKKADRIIVGIRTDTKRTALEELFKPFTSQIIFMRTESAEMVKHALNSFLALSITFINEVARLCEHMGADAKEVAMGLKTEPRIGPRAYLGPGGPFAGGTLARDVVTLTMLGESTGEKLELIPAIKRSNDEHRGWAFRQLQMRLGDLSNRAVAVLGLVYTPNTDTLRRSAAVELCHQLQSAGARVLAFDPVITKAPPELGDIKLVHGMEQALEQADAAAICTEWPRFREVTWAPLIASMRRALVIDANRFLEKPLQGIAGVEHISVGRA